MTEDEFRRLALSLPESIESAHMGHPDFRVGNKIFATLGYPAAGWAMVKLTVDEQEAFLASHPKVFVRVSGAWGARGATNVELRRAPEDVVGEALRSAWRSTAPVKLRKRHEGQK